MHGVAPGLAGGALALAVLVELVVAPLLVAQRLLDRALLVLAGDLLARLHASSFRDRHAVKVRWIALPGPGFARFRGQGYAVEEVVAMSRAALVLLIVWWSSPAVAQEDAAVAAACR